MQDALPLLGFGLLFVLAVTMTAITAAGCLPAWKAQKRRRALRRFERETLTITLR